MIANVALDYTEFAPPLTADDVRRDLDEHYLSHCKYPDKIVVWVHQWDYLTKKYAHLKPAYILERAELDDVGLYVTMRPAKSSDGGTLWGVPVEVLDPDD